MGTEYVITNWRELGQALSEVTSTLAPYAEPIGTLRASVVKAGAVIRLALEVDLISRSAERPEYTPTDEDIPW